MVVKQYSSNYFFFFKFPRDGIENGCDINRYLWWPAPLRERAEQTKMIKGHPSFWERDTLPLSFLFSFEMI